MLAKQIINFNFLFNTGKLLFFYLLNRFENFKNFLFNFCPIVVKKNINIFFFKLFKKNTYLSKRRNNYFFKNNYFFLINASLKKKKFLQKSKFSFFYPYGLYNSSFSFLGESSWRLIGSYQNKFLTLNENPNTFFLRNEHFRVLKKKTKKKININFFKKSLINFFFFLNKRKSSSLNSFLKFFNFLKLSLKSANFFKQTYYKFFLFLNNSTFSRSVKNKTLNLLELFFSLESFYFLFFISLKKRIYFSKNPKNKYFFKNSDFLNIKISKKETRLNRELLQPFFSSTNKLNFFPNTTNRFKNLKFMLNRGLDFFKNRNFFNYSNLKNKKTLNKKVTSLTTILNSFQYVNPQALKHFFLINLFDAKNTKYLKLKKFFKKIFRRKNKPHRFFLAAYKKIVFFSLKKNAFSNVFKMEEILSTVKKQYRDTLPYQGSSFFFKCTLTSNKFFFFRSLNFCEGFFPNNLTIFKSNARFKTSFKAFSQNLFFYKNKESMHIFLFSRVDNSFVNGLNGFLFTQTFKNLINPHEFSFYYKKTLYSFLGKNELQRYILKKYLKNFSILSFNNADTDNGVFPFKFSNSENYSPFLIQSVLDKNWISFEKTLDFTRTFDESLVNFSIKKIKFKPGYMTLWREARSVLKITWKLNFRYQQKLTRYLLQYKKFVKYNHVMLEDFKLINVLTFSKLTPDFHTSNDFIQNGLVFINGLITLNPTFQIFKNDFIQLIVSYKYYIVYKFLLNYAILKKMRLRHKSRNKVKAFQLEDDKQHSHILPNWITDNKNLILDVPNFLEVDYFTLSIFCLFSWSKLDDVSFYSFLDIRYGILNLYNWKYIN